MSRLNPMMLLILLISTFTVSILGIGFLLSLNPPDPNQPIPTESIPPRGEDTIPQDPNTIDIQDIGIFDFDPALMSTIRPDIFNPGYFSVFDILVFLDNHSEINLNYSFNVSMNTYEIHSLNNDPYWWYEAYYSGGWRESNIFRMDHFPVKDEIRIIIRRVPEVDLLGRYLVFREEITRKKLNEHLVIPEVIIRGKSVENSHTFTNVVVTPHNLRNDMFVNDTITAIDIILSLGDSGNITFLLKWYESIGRAGVVKNYWVEAINTDRASGYCGFVYETGDEDTRFRNHIHIPSDIRVINSPEYAIWFWIELGSCGPSGIIS